MIQIVRKEKNCGGNPPRTFTDYDIFLSGKKLDGVGLSDEDKNLVQGVEIIEML